MKSNVRDNKITIKIFGRMGKKFQRLEEQDQNSNVWKDRKGNLMLERIS